MALRNTSADTGRKGAPSQTKAAHGRQMAAFTGKGEYLPAYGGGMGKSAAEVDPNVGTALDEVGNDRD